MIRPIDHYTKKHDVSFIGIIMVLKRRQLPFQARNLIKTFKLLNAVTFIVVLTSKIYFCLVPHLMIRTIVVVIYQNV